MEKLCYVKVHWYDFDKCVVVIGYTQPLPNRWYRFMVLSATRISKKSKKIFIQQQNIPRLRSIYIRMHGVLRRLSSFMKHCDNVGTDFSLMQAFFPHRTRKQLKLKFMRSLLIVFRPLVLSRFYLFQRREATSSPNQSDADISAPSRQVIQYDIQSHQ